MKPITGTYTVIYTFYINNNNYKKYPLQDLPQYKKIMQFFSWPKEERCTVTDLQIMVLTILRDY